jgi:hypothetical protein
MLAKRLLKSALFSIGAAALLVGCGGSEHHLSRQERAAFNDATPEIKQTWESALAADKEDDYVTASTQYRALMSQTITSEQLAVVQAALNALNHRMNEAAARGSAEAQQAIQTLQTDVRGRR